MLVLLSPMLAPAWARPEARAGLSFLAYPGEAITLDGGASADSAGLPLTYAWVQVAGPPVALRAADTVGPAFDAETPGVHRFELRVQAGGSTSAPDVVDVIVVDPDIAATAAGAPAEGGCQALPAPAVPLALPLLLGVALRARRRP
jgi:hypothetical protein